MFEEDENKCSYWKPCSSGPPGFVAAGIFALFVDAGVVEVELEDVVDDVTLDEVGTASAVVEGAAVDEEAVVGATPAATAKTGVSA